MWACEIRGTKNFALQLDMYFIPQWFDLKDVLAFLYGDPLMGMVVLKLLILQKGDKCSEEGKNRSCRKTDEEKDVQAVV